MNIGDAMQQATEHLRAARLSDAERLFRQVLAERPTYPDALHLLGCTLAKRGNAVEAADLISRAVNLEPGNATYQTNFGLALLTLGRKREAAAALQKSLKLNPNQPGVLNLVGN